MTDATNAFGGFYLARAAQICGLRLIGETTGGSQSGINGGTIVFVKLPGSGLEFDLPVIGTFSDRSPKGLGIQPSVQVPATAEDIEQGRDAALEKAISLVTQGR
ncbi:MAG: hypothetical protein AAF127_01565 [Pseudomonadota bacterium]